MKFLLVMTACINVGAPEEIALREQEYESALDFWLRNNDPRLTSILFIENSGHPLTAMRERAARSWKKVEFISLNLNDSRPKNLHYGFSEMQMLDAAIYKSKLVRESTHMIKVNGRTPFPGLPRLLDRLGKFECAVDARRKHVTTQLFLCSIDFYRERLSGAYLEMVDNPRHIERVYLDRLLPLRGRRGVKLRFPVNCDPVGRAGHWGKSYDGWKHRSKSLVRSVASGVAPWWWI